MTMPLPKHSRMRRILPPLALFIFSSVLLLSLKSDRFKPLYVITDLGAMGKDSTEFTPERAVMINNAGYIAGNLITGPNNTAQGFIWSQVRGRRLLPDAIVGLDQSQSTGVYAIHDTGELIGWGKPEPGDFILSKANGLRKLADLIPDASRVYDLNNAGQVVTASKTGQIWSQEGGLHPFGSDPGVSYSSRGTNERGDVVGSLKHIATPRNAFLWQDGQAVDLNNLIPKRSGWELRDAYDINDNGWIVGVGRKNDEWRAYLLRPIPGINK